MKKVISILLILVLLMVSCSAFAGDEHSEPILFRGAQWGSSLDEVKKFIPDGVKMRDLKITEYWYPMDSLMNDGNDWGSQYKAEMGGYSYAQSSSLKDVKVAGYDIEDLYLYFMYVPGEDGLLVKDDAHTALIYAYYKLEPKNPDAVYDDLISKLTSLYGDVDREESSTGLIDRKMSQWNGADGTMVSVFREDYSTTGSHYIYIKYGFKGGDDLMKAAYDATVLEESKGAASNVDGL